MANGCWLFVSSARRFAACSASHSQESHPCVFIAVGRDVCSLFVRLRWVLRITARVTSIAFFEPGHRFDWRHDRLVRVNRVSGSGKLVADTETYRDEQGREEFLVIIFFSRAFGIG